MKHSIVKTLLLLSLLLISVGSTIAYLTDVDKEVNVMTLGRVEIDLIEQERNTAGTLVDFQDFHPLYPGYYPKGLDAFDKDGHWLNVQNAVDKIVTVKNTGKAPAYVRLWFAFEVTDDDKFFNKIHLNRNTTDWQWEFMYDKTTGNFDFLTQDGSRYVVATATYNKVLAPGATTPVSLRQVLLDSSATNDDYIKLGDQYGIFVVAQGMQTAGFDSAAVALAEGFGVPSVANHPFAGMQEDKCTFSQHDELIALGVQCPICHRGGATQAPTTTPKPGVPENCPEPNYHSMMMAMAGYCKYCGENACAVMHDTLMERDGKCPYCGEGMEEEECKHPEKEYIRTNAQVHTVYCKNSSCEVWNLGTETHTYVNGICVCGATNGNVPTKVPTQAPTQAPTQKPTAAPTATTTQAPTKTPTHKPTSTPTSIPTIAPTATPASPESLFVWKLNDTEDGIIILLYRGTATDVVIPNTIKGLPVTGIDEVVFKFSSASLTSITLPDSLTSINSAFSGYTSLTSITIPESVTSIGDDAFRGCTSLTNITIPDSVTSIGYNAFSGCTSLTNITIPDSVTSIGNYAFSGCESLTSITLPDSVTNIGICAFWRCKSLTSITIPNSVTSIGDTVFSNCTSLTSITIPDSVTRIGSDAFSGCTSLTNITIPDSVTDIGKGVFSGCTSLTNIQVVANNAHYISINGVLFTSNRSSLLTYPAGKKGGYSIPDSVTYIGVCAFSDCTSLTSITIPNSVTYIGDAAFSNCTSLTSITIPDSVTSIGYNTFSGCTSLTNITIPDSVTSIGGYAFSYCPSLTSITIPESVTSIGDCAFSDCTNLTSLTIPASVTSIGSGAFANCDDLEVNVYQGSYAHIWCVKSGVDFNIITK